MAVGVGEHGDLPGGYAGPLIRVQQSDQRPGRPFSALGVVHVGKGVEAHQHVRVAHHPWGEIGVEVQSGDDGGMRADGLPDMPEHAAGYVGFALCALGAVQGEQHTLYGGFAQRSDDLLDQVVQQTVFEGASRPGDGTDQSDPFDGFVQHLGEPRKSLQFADPPIVAHDLRAGRPAERLEVREGRGDGIQTIGFLRELTDGDAFHGVRSGLRITDCGGDSLVHLSGNT